MTFKNFQDLVNEFINGGTNGKVGNLKLVGDLLIHYETTIAERYNGKIIVNLTRYSVQTGRLQKLLRSSIPTDLIQEVTRIPKGHKKGLYNLN